MTMRALPHLSFKRKLTVSAMLTSGVALLLAAAAFTTYEVIVFRRGMLANLARTARIIGDNSSAALSFRDPSSAVQTLGSLSADPHIVAAAVYDEQGRLFATYVPAGRTTPARFPAAAPDGHTFGDTTLELFQTIALRGEKAGTVYLSSDLEEMRARLLRYLWIVVGVLITSSLVAWALASRLHRAIARPVTHLSTVADRVAAEKNFSLRATKDSDDELGQLVDAFNEMLGQIQARDAALLEAQELLEQRVAERTRQLSDENAERRRSEAALRESNQRFEIVTRATTDAIWDWDLATGQIWWNENYSVVFGRVAEPSTVESWMQRLHPDDLPAVKESIGRTIAGTGNHWMAEYRYRRADGGYTVVVDRGYVLRDEHGRGWRMIGAMQDMTAQRAAEAELQRANRELVEISRRAGQAEVATSVLHNVGNVLNSVIVSATVAIDRVRGLRAKNVGQIAALLAEHQAALGEFFRDHPKGKVIVGYLPQLAESLEGDREALMHELRAVVRNVEHIKEIITRQQGLARTVGVLESVPVAEIIEHALSLNAPALQFHRVTVERKLAPVPAFPVDKHRLTQILVNLIRNAGEALQHARPAGGPRLTLGLELEGEVVRVRVADNGIGIAPENLNRIFQHGFTTRRDGHGFGLHSGALAARDLGGRLSVTSDGPGRGAAFILEFPFKPAASCSPATTAS